MSISISFLLIKQNLNYYYEKSTFFGKYDFGGGHLQC